MLWPFGGSFLDENFKSNLNSAESQAGLQFRQELMAYMPDGIFAYDHAETVNGFAQSDIAMITEIVQEWGTKMMLGEVTTEEGATEIGTRMEEVLDSAGYYSGEKPLAQ